MKKIVLITFFCFVNSFFFFNLGIKDSLAVVCNGITCMPSQVCKENACVDPDATNINIDQEITVGCSGGSCTLNNPLGENMTDPNIFIGKIINSILGIVGSIALAMFIYGGFNWMTAMGDKNKVTVGKDTILYATLGLIVIFTAYAMVNFVLKDVLMQT